MNTGIVCEVLKCPEEEKDKCQRENKPRIPKVYRDMVKPSNKPCHAVGREDPCAHSRPCHGYKFRYDDGYSAKIGAKRVPLLLRPPGGDNPSLDSDYSFLNPPSPLKRPSRIGPPKQEEWWDQKYVCLRYHFLEKPAPRPRYMGLHVDPTYDSPNEAIIRDFSTPQRRLDPAENFLQL